MTSDRIIKAAIRLNKGADLALVMGHLVAAQAAVVLSMQPENKERLQMALVYHNALDGVLDLVKNLAEETDNE